MVGRKQKRVGERYLGNERRKEKEGGGIQKEESGIKRKKMN